MSHSCAQWRGEIGAYIVGALDDAASERVTRHLAVCTGCRADYDELIPVRDSLDVLALTAGMPEPGPDQWPGHPPHDSFRAEPVPAARADMDLVPRPRRGSGTKFPARPAGTFPAVRPRARRWLMAAGAALAAAAAAIAVLVSSGASVRTFNAADSATGVSGHAQLRGTPTGTQIDLTASGLPRNERCILVAVTNDGSDIAGSWGATYAGSARITGTTEFRADQLTALRIESGTGILLLNIRV